MFNFSFLLLPESVQTTVGLSLSTDVAAQSEGGELAGVDAMLIQMPNVDLNRSVVLGGDQPVRRRAFPRDVELGDDSFLVLHLGDRDHNPLGKSEWWRQLLEVKSSAFVHGLM